MFHNVSHQGSGPGQRSSVRRFLRASVPGAVLGALVWLVPGVSEAAPRCTSKPAVCARLAQQKAARATPAAPLMVAQADRASRCTTKPTVCARLGTEGTRAASPPVTLAQSFAPDARCSTKPAVCARMKMRPSAPDLTLASQ